MKHVFRQFFISSVGIVLLVLLCFVLLRYSPGSIFDSERMIDPRVKEMMEAQFGLSNSVSVQFFLYLRGIVSGDWGTSVAYPDVPTGKVIGSALVAGSRLYLGSGIVILSSCFAVIMISLHFLTLGGIRRLFFIVTQLSSFPSLFIVPFFVWFFGLYLGLLPVVVDETWVSWILPIVCLCLRPISVTIKIFLSQFLQVIREDFVVTARSKGLSPSQVNRRHVLANSLLPVLATIPATFLYLLSGSFVIETMFSIQGIGQLMVTSLLGRDDMVVIAIILMSSIFMLVMSRLTDLICKQIDPRIQPEEYK